jgi:hypothetical protein
MVAVTYGTARVAAGTAPRESVFTRLIAMIESRTQQARREFRARTQSQAKSQAEELPFGGW